MLGSSIDTSVDGGGTNACIWTTAYCTLPSLYQVTGAYYYCNDNNINIEANVNDIGEANYKIPLYAFRYYVRSPGASSWIRSTRYYSSGCKSYYILSNNDGVIAKDTKTYNISISNLTGTNLYSRPLIYIR